MWVGVASQKNTLGVICALSVFLIFWTFLRERRAGTFLKNKLHTFAEGIVFVISMHLLFGFRGVYPATAIGFLIIGLVSLIFLNQKKNNIKRASSLLIITVTVGLLCLTFIESLVPIVTSTLGRDESFTGRTDIWRLVINAASRKPLLGYGYGAFYGLQSEKIGQTSSHSGYLDVYLETGIVGIVLLFSFLWEYYCKALREFRDSRDWGLFGICILIMSLLHNFTEGNFLGASSYLWNITVFISIIFSRKRVYRNLDL
jgi:O-antigen ligase